MTPRVIGFLAASSLALGGCLEARVDEADPGTFLCAEPSDCESGQSCLLGICEDAEQPRVEIRFPKAYDRIEAAGATGPIPVSISIGGHDLALAEPGDDDGPGHGYVELAVDGQVVGTMTAGDLVAGVVGEVMIDPTPGAHRITATARTRGGERYDNAEARATRLVWIDDGQPHVAFVQPWPGDSAPLGAPSIDVELAAINFEFLPADAVATGWRGHVHLHYERTEPDCTSDPSCDCCPLAEVMPYAAPYDGSPIRTVSASVRLPEGYPGAASLSASLRQADHAALQDAHGQYVHDITTLQRSDESGDRDDG